MSNDFVFETDHSQYMSLTSPETFIPLSLELRARAALKELADIKREYSRVASELKDIEAVFELHYQRYENELKEREEKFDDAMSHFLNTKDDWVRQEDSEGNVQWVDTSYMRVDPTKPLPFWPFGDTSDFY